MTTTNMTIAEQLVALTDALGENGAQNLLELLIERNRAANPSTVDAAIQAAAESVRTRSAGFGAVGDESIALPVVPDEAWNAAEVTDRPLNLMEAQAISLHGADALLRLNADGVPAHPANTVRMRPQRADRDNPAHQQAMLALYYTTANGVDCENPVLVPFAQARKLFIPQAIIDQGSLSAEQVVWGRSQAWDASKGPRPMNPETGELLDRCSIYSVRTFVMEMEIAGVKQMWRFFAPKSVSSVLWTCWKQNTVESAARKLLPRTFDLQMTDIHRFDAAVRIDRISRSFTHAPINAIAAGTFRFNLIRSSQLRAQAINSAANALFLARTESMAEKAALIEKLLNDPKALLAYRVANAESRDKANAAEAQEQHSAITPAVEQKAEYEMEPPF